MKPSAKLPDDSDIERLTDSGYLRHAFKSPSKYAVHWLELKYTYRINLAIPDVRGNHRKYRQAIARLKLQDEYFRALSLQIYGKELAIQSKSIDANTLEIRLTDNNSELKFS